MRFRLRGAAVVAVLAVGCGDLSLAGSTLAHTDSGELTLFAGESSPSPECVEQKALSIAQAYRGNLLPKIRARVDSKHPRFRAVADSERAELVLADGTRLLLPLEDRVAAAVRPDGAHILLEIPASMALTTCLE